jgi:hypothetical protein
MGDGDCDYVLCDVAQARWSGLDGSMELLDHKGGIIGRVPAALLWSHARMKEVIHEINQRVRAKSASMLEDP